MYMQTLIGLRSHCLLEHSDTKASEVLRAILSSTLLSNRFDRTSDGRRIHYASALTMLGLKDGAGSEDGYGYLDIVDFIIRNCTDVEKNVRELYRRVVFNICIGNSDDHFRNHGFLLTAKGWTLAPAFDLNPTINRYQGIMISRDTNESDLDALLKAAEDYFIPKAEAEGNIYFIEVDYHIFKVYLPSFRQRPIHGNQYQAPLPRIPAQREYELHSYCGFRYDNKAPQVYPSEESLLQSLYMNPPGHRY